MIGGKRNHSTAPARELLGFRLLDASPAKEATVAFDAVLKKEPNRFLALYGAGQAAEAAKRTTRAKQLYVPLVAMCKDAPADRAELAHARKLAN